MRTVALTVLFNELEMGRLGSGNLLETVRKLKKSQIKTMGVVVTMERNQSLSAAS